MELFTSVRNRILHSLAAARTGAVHLDIHESLQERLKSYVLLPENGEDDEGDAVVGDARRRVSKNEGQHD